MEENYKLLSTVLKELQKAGVLKHLILAGSWCQYFYRTVFNASPEIPLLRTTDIDLLIPNPPKIRVHVDVPHILTRLGFDAQFDYKTGLIKYVHPDLEIQFLTPALGRGKDSPYSIKQLGINAEGLRYLTLLQNYCFEIKHEGITLWLPEPEAFVLQKILASQERNDSVDTHGLTPVALIILMNFNFHLWHSTTDLRPWSSANFDKKREGLRISPDYW